MSWKLIVTAILFAAIGTGLLIAGPLRSAAAACSCCRHGATASTESGVKTALSRSDRELIEKQKVCPVTGAALGSMGTPVKVMAKGRTVFLCCAGCKKKIMADPDKYLKKLDEKKDEKK